MVQQVQFQQIGQPGLGASAAILNQRSGMLNQNSKNKTDLINSLIGGGSKIGTQVLAGQQAEDLQKQKEPFQLLNAVDDLGKAADQARARGDTETADRLDGIVGGALGSFGQDGTPGSQSSSGFGGIKGLIGGIGNKLGFGKGQDIVPQAQQASGGGIQDLLPQPQAQGANQVFQPIQAEEPVSSPSVGNEFGPALGIEPNLSPTTNVALGAKQTEFIKGKQDIELKSQDIQQNRTKARVADITERRILAPILLNDTGTQTFSYKSPITNQTETLPNSGELKSSIQTYSQLSDTEKTSVSKSNIGGADNFIRFTELAKEAEKLLRKEKRPGFKQVKDIGRFFAESEVPFTTTRLGQFIPGPVDEKRLDTIQSEMNKLLPLMLVVDIQGSRPSETETAAVANAMPSVTQDANVRALNTRRTAGNLGGKIANNLLILGATDKAKKVIEVVEFLTGEKYEFGKALGIKEPEVATDFIKLTGLQTQPAAQTTGADTNQIQVDFTPEDVDSMSDSEKVQKYLELKRKGLIDGN
tara:strand:- start:1097 stop:2680 length:1584 start_codon:yes stop_codon:yes gene_type:complete